MAKPPFSFSRYVLGASGVLALRKDDFLLAGYYRSGTTWIRLLLCNFISLSELGGRDVGPILQATMPELGINNLLKPWRYSTIPRVIKTHRPYSSLLGRAPSIGLIRDPRDVMVSRYHKRRDILRDYDGTFSGFLRHPRFGLEDWFRHYVSWRSRWILVVTYEDLHEDTHREFSRILGALGRDQPNGILSQAITRSDFRKVQQAEKAKKPGAGGAALHYRSGSSGQWIPYFNDEDLVLYQQLRARYDVHLYA